MAMIGMPYKSNLSTAAPNIRGPIPAERIAKATPMPWIWPNCMVPNRSAYIGIISDIRLRRLDRKLWPRSLH